uniref:Ribonuclease H protein At1g65750 family n=1 Tax=Cajanus cajan TaxID=3821 RepID=A0A151RA68_CAJCA|nr:Putative ribonuclease H protein At1g65750 family [Cajanus cajan]
MSCSTNISEFASHPQAISFTVVEGSKSWVCTAVYANPRVELRQRVWAHLRELGGRITLPWLVLGDFNEIMLSTECRGGRFSMVGVSQFLEVLNDCNLLDMGAKGLRFTWYRNQRGVVLAKRLDRAVCNVAWQAMFPEAYVENLCRVYSDHCPLLLRHEGSRDKSHDRPFRFQAAWATHKDFERIVREAWCHSTPTLANWLQAVRVDAIKFNKEVFGNIITRKKALQRRLKGVQLQLEIGESESLSRLEKAIQAELDETCLQEEYLWFQKSREKWVRFGDRNTSFFHAQTLARRRRNKIQGLFLLDGSWHIDPVVMKTKVVRFFKELFSINNEQGSLDMHAGVPPGLGVEAQSALTVPVTKEEVRRAVMSMKSFKAPGPDGFQPFFFKQYWPIVGDELWRVGSLALKIDLEKAYDRVRWDFLESTLNSSISLLWNGSTLPSFVLSRGLRQGDPLSPYLFVFCMERLALRISELLQEGHWKPIQLSPRGLPLSHLLFADDILLFCQASKDQTRLVASILEEFSRSSSLRFNLTKSKFRRIDMLEGLLGIGHTARIEKYLGFPMTHGQPRCADFYDVMDKIQGRLGAWKSKLLNKAGKLCLVKSTISSIPVYSMQTLWLSPAVCNRIYQACRRMLWGKSDNTRFWSPVSWDVVTQPKEFGGLGVREARRVNVSLLGKLVWDLLTAPQKPWV